MCAWWMVVLLVTVSDPVATDEASTNKLEKLVENLRRQLMENNYDYMSDSDDQLTTTTEQTDLLVEDRLTRRRDESDTPSSLDEISRVFSGKELNRSSKTNELETSNSDPHHTQFTETGIEDVKGDITTRASDAGAFKYKMLKMKRGESSRRHDSGYRSFIQEEGTNGVAIIKLDEGPFPEFRLPKSRRQYMFVDDSQQMPAPAAALEEPGAVADASVKITTQAPIMINITALNHI